MVAIEHLHRLQSPEGTALLAAIRALDPTPASGLATIARLRKQYAPDLVAAGMSIHHLRIQAREKFPNADDLWFTRDGLEQATHHTIAVHRAARFTGASAIVDLCCGIGGDAIALVGIARLTIVDRDPVHLAMASANISASGHSATAVAADVTKLKLAPYDAAFIDPARRDATGRHATGVTEPSLAWCTSVAGKVARTGIKLAPGLPHSAIPEGWAFETIALGFDLKEGVLWSPAFESPAFAATIAEGDTAHTFTAVPGSPVPTRAPERGDIVHDPNPAIGRAGLVEDLARHLGAERIDEKIAFLVGGNSSPSPFARGYRVLASLPWHERNVKQAVIDLEGGEVIVRRRGLPGNVDDITKRLRGAGHRSLWIAMTRVDDRPWAIVAEPIPT